MYLPRECTMSRLKFFMGFALLILAQRYDAAMDKSWRDVVYNVAPEQHMMQIEQGPQLLPLFPTRFSRTQTTGDSAQTGDEHQSRKRPTGAIRESFKIGKVQGPYHPTAKRQQVDLELRLAVSRPTTAALSSLPPSEIGTNDKPIPSEIIGVSGSESEKNFRHPTSAIKNARPESSRAPSCLARKSPSSNVRSAPELIDVSSRDMGSFSKQSPINDRRLTTARLEVSNQLQSGKFATDSQGLINQDSTRNANDDLTRKRTDEVPREFLLENMTSKVWPWISLIGNRVHHLISSELKTYVDPLIPHLTQACLSHCARSPSGIADIRFIFKNNQA
ncbi:uncharacterized protein PGTG_07934 [Puccinia graminis f. sp. tritici CRL 75-36-700-3]|uniref:Uncharacterized protein n=1 Tax=Puccinia graminis f. sp. tritici (strain CRL 75-36-700-3 / race SCCL) TaxID=418459 RepID=E3KBI7_PUCGT|nr:uncharacterized protein PGTG_07934 [Puccinia graminis f. sp. tritici CRL 75-36-700-3]EFP81685.2 hypothetical protein PGTG_07934 [Puccinia graminis f. sp. tritici CRL 75-36-700-3]